MAPLSKHQYIYLSEEERVLLLSDGSRGRNRTLAEVADTALFSMSTVRNVKRNYLSGDIEAVLQQKPRPGAEPTFKREVEAHLVMLACSTPPEGHAFWSLRLGE